jgi:hypothetical protein
MAPSPKRGRVCNLLLLLGLASEVPLGSVSRETQDHISLSQFFRLPQPGGPGPRIYIPHGLGGSVIPPGNGFPFHRLLRLAGLSIQYVPGVLSRAVKRPGREAHHSPPTSAEVKKIWIYRVSQTQLGSF